jgi:hypothetical protein
VSTTPSSFTKVETELNRLTDWLATVGNALTEEEAEQALKLTRRMIGKLRKQCVLESGRFFRSVLISERSIKMVQQQHLVRGQWTGAPVPEEAWVTFLDVLKKTRNVAEASKQAKTSRAGAYNRRKTNAEFNKLWQAAMD